MQLSVPSDSACRISDTGPQLHIAVQHPMRMVCQPLFSRFFWPEGDCDQHHHARIMSQLGMHGQAGALEPDQTSTIDFHSCFKKRYLCASGLVSTNAQFRSSVTKAGSLAVTCKSAKEKGQSAKRFCAPFDASCKHI